MAALLPTLANGLDLAIAAMQAATKISTMVQFAQGQGRETFTAEEWAQITGNEDSAEAQLSAAIAAAKARGQ